MVLRLYHFSANAANLADIPEVPGHEGTVELEFGKTI